MSTRSLNSWVATVTAIVAVLGLLFGAFEYLHLQHTQSEKPYLEKKLQWCVEAVETASAIAIATDGDAPREQRFWAMYYGVMGLVERETITDAMIAFGKELNANRERSRLQTRSLELAHACRAELARDWSPRWGSQRS